MPSTTTSSNTKYRVSGGSTQYDSPFEAIGLAAKSGGYVTETDSGTEIFRANTNKYYLFQFTCFYGSTTSRSEAQNWISNYHYAYAISGATGDFIGCSSTVLKGGTYRLEPNSGGYYYNFSNGDWIHRAIETTVSLSQAQLHFSHKNRKDNAYVFVAAISPDGAEVLEAGIILDQYARADGGWKGYHRLASGGLVSSNVIVPTTVSNNIYTANKDIVIKMNLRSDAPGITYTICDTNGEPLCDPTNVDASSNSRIRAGEPVQFLVGVSFVPDFGFENNAYSIQDLRDGAYFRNIILESYLYVNSNFDPSGKHGFTATSDPPAYSYIHCNDTVNYTRGYNGNYNKEVIDIYYNKPYTQ